MHKIFVNHQLIYINSIWERHFDADTLNLVGLALEFNKDIVFSNIVLHIYSVNFLTISKLLLHEINVESSKIFQFRKISFHYIIIICYMITFFSLYIFIFKWLFNLKISSALSSKNNIFFTKERISILKSKRYWVKNNSQISISDWN